MMLKIEKNTIWWESNFLACPITYELTPGKESVAITAHLTGYGYGDSKISSTECWCTRRGDWEGNTIKWNNPELAFNFAMQFGLIDDIHESLKEKLERIITTAKIDIERIGA